ncbi:sensor histidine kinase [Psychroserpens sp. MEBiC05023]
MKQKNKYICILLFLGAVLYSYSQNRQLRAYTLEDGLPQSQVYAMAQDEKGYLWLGTQGGGLARFDGNNFRVFNNKHGLASNYINAIHTLNNTIFIGTKEGLSVRKKAKFFNTKTPEIIKISEIDNQILLLTIQGVFRVKEDFSVEKIKLHPEIDNLQINDVLVFNDYIWLAMQDGLWRFSGTMSNPKLFQKLERGNFKALVGSQNKIFASTFNDGTLAFESDDFETQILIREPLRINSASIFNTNELWIATDSNGVTVINTETNSELFTLNGSNGLSVPNVRQVLQDGQSNIWMATSGGGLYKYFQNNFKHFNTETGLNGDRVYAVHAINNAIWLSNSEAGLMRIDDFGIHDIETPDPFSNVKIKTITSDVYGNIWAGSDGRGILFQGERQIDSYAIDTLKRSKKLIPKTEKIIKVFNTENGFPEDWIRKISTFNNTIYVATYSSGVVKLNYHIKSDSITIAKTFATAEGIQDLYIKDLVKDSNNRFWYSTRNGHLGYLQNNTVSHLGQVLDLQVPINTILFQNNIMFLGTAGQGIWWSNDDDFSTFKKLKGLKKTTSENIYQLIFDNQGYLWVGTERGVDKLELDKDTQIKDAFFFGRNDGFLGIETCLNAVDKDDKGHLWFGALYGLTEYQPAETNLDAEKPIIYLEDVKVAFKSIDSIDLASWTNTKNILQLNPEQTQVSFSYKTVDLDHPNGIEYRYKLNDNNWSPWSPITTQDYSELNFGSHDFVVQSRNHRWKESDPLHFSFYIEPPLYKKTWFQWTIIGFILLVLSGLTYLYIKRIKRNNAKEKERLELENHLLSLEQKALRLQMNPHFIFNVLNGIKAMAPSQPDKMNDTVNSFATLLRETLVNSRKDTIGLDQEIKTLRHYIEVERLMADTSFTYDIEINTDLDIEEILVPPMLIQPFVENAIRHGILKGPRDGELKIQFETSEDKLKVTVSDNGIGIYHSQQHKPKTDHQSMALKVTRERLESISGKGALKIHELKHNNGSISGTTIVFEIPLETDY